MEKKDLYPLLMMNKKEIELIEPEYFSIDNFHLLQFFGLLHKKTWEWFSYEQLMHMNYKVFNYLNEDILHMLYDKFKNNKTLIIKKKIKEKEILIKSEPLAIKIINSLEYKEKKKEKFASVHTNLLRLQEYGDNEPIPLSIIKKALLLSDTTVLTLNKKYIRKRDLLDYLERICNKDIHLTEIPDLSIVQVICHEFDMTQHIRRYQHTLAHEAKAGNIMSFTMKGYVYYLYDDIINHIIKSL